MPPTHADAAEKSLVCGGCQWFKYGTNCQKARLVEPTTVACIEFHEVLPDLYAPMLNDKVIEKLREAFSHPRLRIDMSLIDEMKGYLLDDNLDFPHGSASDLEAISGCAKRMLNHKSRVSSIFSAILEAKHDYDELYRDASSWLYAHYPAIRNLKNDTQRQAAFDHLFPESVRVHQSIRKVTAIAEKVEDKLALGEKFLKIISSTSERVYSSKEGLSNVRRHT